MPSVNRSCTKKFRKGIERNEVTKDKDKLRDNRKSNSNKILI